MTDFLHNAAEHFPEPFRLLIRDEAGSTNDELRMLAEQGAPHGLILAARRQTSGRGRRGNTWHSNPGEALTISVLIRPTEPKSYWARLALASGLAIAETIESFGLESGIKWPNDVWIGSRKVAGVLVEAGPSYVIIGIGLNVNALFFPEELSQTATSLRIAYGTHLPVPEVLDRLVGRIAVRHHQIGNQFPDLMAAIRVRCVLTGNRVSLSTPTGQITGIIDGLSDTGELLLRDQDTLHRLIQADEVRVI